MNPNTEKMSMSLTSIVASIEALSPQNVGLYREKLVNLNNVANELNSIKFSEDEFLSFLNKIHNQLVTGETMLRGVILRILRLCISLPFHCEAIVFTEIHWLVLASLERDHEYVLERMQALKLIKLFITIMPEQFPISFARSLVAVATHKDDNLRRVCLETLRELSVLNPSIVVQINGLSCLLDAVIEPSTQDMAESILVSILYLMNDPKSRQFMRPHLDLRVLLAPFSELDGDSTDLSLKWRSAQRALVTIMRTWVGVIYLTSDPLALPTLIGMLSDTMIAAPVQEVILDAFIEIFSPVTSKTKRRRISTLHAHENSLRSLDLSDTSGPVPTPGETLTENPTGGSSSRRPSATGWLHGDNRGSTSDKHHSNPTTGSAGIVGIHHSGSTGTVNTSTGNNVNNPHSNNSNNPMNNVTMAAMAAAGSNNNSNVPAPPSSGFSLLGTISRVTGTPFSPPTFKKRAPVNPSAVATAAASFGNSGSGSGGGTGGGAGGSGSGGSTGGSASGTTGHSGSFSGNSTSGGTFTQRRPSTFDTVSRKKTLSAKSHEDETDSIYNLLDNYSALLCCSFVHAGLVDALCVLGTRGEADLARKSRKLLLDLLRVIARIFPENYCSDLLTMPALVKLATSYTDSSTSTTDLFQASQILLSLADAFSIASSAAPTNDSINNANEDGVTGGNGGGYGNSNSNGMNMPAPRGSILPSSSLPLRHRATTSSAATLNAAGRYVPTCNVKDIRGLSLELRASSNAHNANYYNTRAAAAKFNLLADLNEKLTLAVDKNDFKKQMDASKVIGKEGKEPFRWDWTIIGDMLKYSFGNDPERLAEALETKWIRRISGFYRCSLDEKGYFANLEWEPANLYYLECACDLYHVLANDENGVQFIGSDRRGMLFNELSRELEQLIYSHGKGWIGAFGPKLVFRFSTCNQNIVREMFTLIGRLCTTKAGRRLLDSTSVFNHLSILGSCRSLDYLSRIVITGLCFTDKGFLSLNLIQIWTTTSNCSSELRSFIHSILLALLRSNPTEFLRWGVNVIVNQIFLDEVASETALHVLLEAVQDPVLLKAVIAKRVNLVGVHEADSIQLRFLGAKEGIEFMKSKEGLTPMLESWEKKESFEYVLKCEQSLSVALQSKLFAPPSALVPIVVPMCDRASGRNSEFGRGSGSFEGEGGGGPLGGDAVDLEGMLRIPWNMEVKVTPQQAYAPSTSSSKDEYLRMDTFLDISSLPSPVSSTLLDDQSRIVVVRGVVLDGRGYPTGHPIASNRAIQNCLLAGVCPVHRNGRVFPITQDREIRAIRRKSSTTNANNIAVSNVGSGGRESMGPTQRGVRPSVSANNLENSQLAGGGADELAVTYQLENLHDWSVCKPGHRQCNVIPLSDNRFAVEVSGEPVRWIFATSLPPSITHAGTTPITTARPAVTIVEDVLSGRDGRNRLDTSATGGYVYLVEVHYHLRLETGLPKFVPIPRHIYGELGRTALGCSIITEQKTIVDLISNVRDVNAPCLQRRASLWCLGHLGSSDAGYSLLASVDPRFIEWCVENTAKASNYSIRATAFTILGLLSRSKPGMRKLTNLQWDCSPAGTNSAVATPRQHSYLFQEKVEGEFVAGDTLPQPGSLYPNRKPSNPPAVVNHSPLFGKLSSGSSGSNGTTAFANLKPFYEPGRTNSVELEVLNLIAKMPGVIVYSECKAKLEAIRNKSPETFNSRTLYVAVLQMLDSFTFKLTARKEIVNYFSTQAKIVPAFSFDI